MCLPCIGSYPWELYTLDNWYRVPRAGSWLITYINRLPLFSTPCNRITMPLLSGVVTTNLCSAIGLPFDVWTYCNINKIIRNIMFIYWVGRVLDKHVVIWLYSLWRVVVVRAEVGVNILLVKYFLILFTEVFWSNGEPDNWVWVFSLNTWIIDVCARVFVQGSVCCGSALHASLS